MLKKYKTKLIFLKNILSIKNKFKSFNSNYLIKKSLNKLFFLNIVYKNNTKSQIYIKLNNYFAIFFNNTKVNEFLKNEMFLNFLYGIFLSKKLNLFIIKIISYNYNILNFYKNLYSYNFKKLISQKNIFLINLRPNFFFLKYQKKKFKSIKKSRKKLLYKLKV